LQILSLKCGNTTKFKGQRLSSYSSTFLYIMALNVSPYSRGGKHLTIGSNGENHCWCTDHKEIWK